MNMTLPMWTIYHDTTDFPGVYTVRRCLIGRGAIIQDRDCRQAETLEEARRLVPPGKDRLERHSDDDPVIVETWI